MTEHHHRIPIALIFALFAVAFACMFFFVKDYRAAKEESAVYSRLISEHTITDTVESYSSVRGELLSYTLPDFDALREVNPDTVGWVAIPGTVINYPVMQYTDNSKYLRYDSTGNKSSAGAAFIDRDNSVDPLNHNTVIYAHNMGSGRQDEMFGGLLEYKDKAFYESHKLVQFDTYLEIHGWWEIFAVIHLDIRNKEFNYLRLQFESDEAFAKWLFQAKKLSIYDTGVAVSENDAVLTLSTCDRSEYGGNGRLLVMAVKRGLA